MWIVSHWCSDEVVTAVTAVIDPGSDEDDSLGPVTRSGARVAKMSLIGLPISPSSSFQPVSMQGPMEAISVVTEAPRCGKR